MHLFSQIQNQLLIFDMDGQEFFCQFGLCSFMPSFVMYLKLNILYCFTVLLHLMFSFLHIRYFLVLYAYVSIESIDCILLSSIKFKVILLISLVKILYLLLLNLCCVSNISLFFTNSLSSLRQSIRISSFFNSLFYIQFEMFLNIFYNL